MKNKYMVMWGVIFSLLMVLILAAAIDASHHNDCAGESHYDQPYQNWCSNSNPN